MIGWINTQAFFSPQDDHNKASNLISSEGTKRWLSNPKDKTGKIDIILQLEEPCHFNYVDIGLTRFSKFIT